MLLYMCKYIFFLLMFGYVFLRHYGHEHCYGYSAVGSVQYVTGVGAVTFVYMPL